MFEDATIDLPEEITNLNNTAAKEESGTPELASDSCPPDASKDEAIVGKVETSEGTTKSDTTVSNAKEEDENMTNEASEIKEAIVAAGTEIDGKITGDAALRIEGLVKGSIDINGPMTILENGRSEADVQATVVVIKGTHKGNIVASESVQVVAGGIVNGDIQTPSILIEKGAKFSGKMEMTNQA